MNKEQIIVMEHALKNGNRFYTESNDTHWNDLVKKGYATKQAGWEDDMSYFRVSREGKEALNETYR